MIIHQEKEKNDVCETGSIGIISGAGLSNIYLLRIVNWDCKINEFRMFNDIKDD